MTSVTITLPLPPRQLWQNSRHNWRARFSVTRAHKNAAYLAAVVAIGRRPAPRWPAGTIDAAFYWPDKRRRDPLNALAAIKAAVDGLVAAGVLNDDDRLMPGRTTFGVDRANPRVVLTITPTNRAAAAASAP